MLSRCLRLVIGRRDFTVRNHPLTQLSAVSAKVNRK